MTACDTLVCIRGTCLVKRHRINAEMWAKLDKIKHTGECTDAGQCSKCAALFMFSNMGSLMRVWCLFFWELEIVEVCETRTRVCGQSFAFCGESGIKGKPSSSPLQFKRVLIQVLEIIRIHHSVMSFRVCLSYSFNTHICNPNVT